MRQITLGKWTSIDPNRNRFRFYRVYLAEDLWGDTAVIKRWGRIGHRPRQQIFWPQSDAELARLLQYTILRRIHHGYRLTGTHTRRK